MYYIFPIITSTSFILTPLIVIKSRRNRAMFYNQVNEKERCFSFSKQVTLDYLL